MPSSSQFERFSLPGALHFEDGDSGLVRAMITAPAASGEVYLHGAHITRWAPTGAKPVLFLSSRSLYEPTKAIRGGVPVIFPWFGPRADGKPGPMHGFARTMEWSIESTHVSDDGAVEINFALAPTDATRGLGYDAFQARFRVVFGQALHMALEVRNASPSAGLDFEQALHTYFSIGDIRQISISGLEHTAYIDKTDNFERKQQSSEPVRITAETDRVYLNTSATCVIEDPAMGRRIVVEKSGSETTVVWNPWAEKTRALSDMQPDDWQHMVCVETANAADNSLRLAPGAAHTLTATIRVA